MQCLFAVTYKWCVEASSRLLLGWCAVVFVAACYGLHYCTRAHNNGHFLCRNGVGSLTRSSAANMSLLCGNLTARHFLQRRKVASHKHSHHCPRTSRQSTSRINWRHIVRRQVSRALWEGLHLCECSIFHDCELLAVFLQDSISNPEVGDAPTWVAGEIHIWVTWKDLVLFMCETTSYCDISMILW